MNAFEKSRAILSDTHTFGVWSVIVTFFGDMAQASASKVSGSALTNLGDHIGIKPQAMRVALHRLRKDGWIDSQKNGRRSEYYLTEKGRSESARASEHIYARSGRPFDATRIMIAPPAEGPGFQDWTQVSDAVFITFLDTAKSAPDALVMNVKDRPPNWIASKLVPAKTCKDFRAFHNELSRIETDEWDTLSVCEIAALRVLIVHHWRRLLLKNTDLPDAAFPIDCPISECRILVSDLLSKLLKPSLDSLA